MTQYVYRLYRSFKRQKLHIFISDVSSAEGAFSQVEKASVLIVIGQMEHPSVFGERTGGWFGCIQLGLLGWCLFCLRWMCVSFVVTMVW